MKWRLASEVLSDKKMSTKLKGKLYRMVVRPDMLYDGVLVSQELSHSEDKSGRDNDIVMDVWVY